MDNTHFETKEPKPGCNRAFGGGQIDRNRKIKGVDPLLIKGLRESYQNYVKKGKTHNAAIKHLGNTCNQIKQIVGHGQFGRFMRMYFPYISMSTVERAMKIDNFIDYETYPAFLLVPQGQLLNISKRYDLETAIDILLDNNIKVEINENDDEAVRAFLSSIKQLSEGNIGFLTITDDEENAEKIIGPGGWVEVKGVINVPPDTEFEIKTAVNSTEFILKSYVGFLTKLREHRDDTGKKLGVEITQVLLSTMIEISETLQLVGPPRLIKPDNQKKLLKFLRNTLLNLELPDDDDNSGDSGDDDLDGDDLDDDKKSIKRTAKNGGKKVLEDEYDEDFKDEDFKDEDFYIVEH